MKINPHYYEITINQIPTPDDEVLFEAKVAELPDVAEYSDSWEDVYDSAIDTIITLAEMHAEMGREFPKANKLNLNPS